MITVNDKLKSFSEKIIERVQQECDKRIREFSKRNNALLEDEHQKALSEAQAIINATRARGEAERQQIIARAEMERDHIVLIKRNEIFTRALEDIKKKCCQYVKSPDYPAFLEICIKTALSAIGSDDVLLEFTSQDMEKHGSHIKAIINKYKKENTKISISEANPHIIGGCLCISGSKTFRIDNTLRSLIDNNLELIGKMLMESLESR